MHEHVYRIYADSVRAVADSLAALADTTGAATQAPGGLPPAGMSPPGQDQQTEGGRLLPSQIIYAVLDTPMVAAALYRVTVTGVINLLGLTDGGGDAPVSAPEPPPPDTATVDSLAAPDSLVVPAVQDSLVVTDSLAVPAAQDSLAVPTAPDGAVGPDTTGVPPDTSGVTNPQPPDTSGTARSMVFGMRRLRD